MLTKRIWDKEYKLVICQDECADDPRIDGWDREWSDLCIRKNRKYDFPNELDFDFDAYDDWEITLPWLDPNQYIFQLDFYEHSWITFSLKWEWMNDRFDSSINVWFIIVSLDNDAEKSDWLARDIAREYINNYNAYLNWEIYEFIIEEQDIITKDWKEYYSWWENYDSCWGFYSFKEASEYINHDIFTEEEILNYNID